MLVQITAPGNALLRVPPVSADVMDIELVQPRSEPVAWFLQGSAACTDGTVVDVLLRFPAAALQ